MRLCAVRDLCSRLQATPGKLLLGLRVAGVNGQRLSYRRASARNLGKLLFFPCSPLFLGYALFSKRRGMHDLFSGCSLPRASAFGLSPRLSYAGLSGQFCQAP